MKKTLLLVLSIVMTSNIAISQTREEKKELKEEKKEKNYEAMKALINSDVYLFEATLLTTTSGRELSIEPKSNALVVEKGSAAGYLQYFGEVTSIDPDDEGGVKFNGKLNNYKVKFIDKRKEINVSFNVKSTSDDYNVSMEINENGSASVNIYSNNKNNITYNGEIGTIKKE